MPIGFFRCVLMPIRFPNLCFSLTRWAFVLFTLSCRRESSCSREISCPCSVLLHFQLCSGSYLSPILFGSLSTWCLSFSLKCRLIRYWRGPPHLNSFSRTHESQKAALMFEIRHMVTELVRLSTLDPSLSEERRFVADLDAGLEHSILGGGATRHRRRVTSRQTAELLRGGVTGRSG